MNKNGQSLVLFVLILPLVFILFSFVILSFDIVNTKLRYESNIKSAIKYGLKHMDENPEEKVRILLDKNIDGNKTVIADENGITVNVKRKIKIYEINLNYTGRDENGKVIIESK